MYIKIINTLLLFSVFLFPTFPVYSADIYSLPNNRKILYLVGLIEEGDYKRLSRFINKNNPYGALRVDSQGGDVRVAMKIGRLIRSTQSLVSVSDNGKCASACIFILAGAVVRATDRNDIIIIHRPYIVSEIRDGHYEETFNQLVSSIREYLNDMNVPQSLVDRMLSIPPYKGHRLTYEEMKKYMLTGKDPVYQQKLLTKNAKKLGISVTEYVRRKSIVSNLCMVFFSFPGSNPEGYFELTGYFTCADTVERGESPTLIRKRMDFLLKNREKIRLRDHHTQSACIDHVIKHGEISHCPF